MFDGKNYENMLSHDYRKYLVNNGSIKLSNLEEDKIFNKFFYETRTLNSASPHKLSASINKKNQSEKVSENISLSQLSKVNTSPKGSKRFNEVKDSKSSRREVDESQYLTFLDVKAQVRTFSEIEKVKKIKIHLIDLQVSIVKIRLKYINSLLII
jgi:hypothetical protein